MVLNGPKGNKDAREHSEYRQQNQDECFRFAFIHVCTFVALISGSCR